MRKQEATMNIVIFACADFPEGPATTSRIRLISRILVEAGHSVSLALFFAPAKKPIPENISIEGTYETIHYRYLNGRTSRPEGFLAALADTVKGVAHSASYLLDKIQSNACDLVLFYTPDLFCCWPCLLLAKRYRIPVVLEMCEIFSSDIVKGLKNNIKRVGSRVSERILPRTSAGVIAISTRIIAFLTDMAVDRNFIYHLPILVDYERFAQPALSPVPALLGRQYFLNSGSLCEKEGLECVMEAFASVSLKYAQLNLVFTGDPGRARKAYALDLAKKLKIEQNIIFTGFLPVDQLCWSYQNAAALICCRSDTAYANFGFPTKLAEYLCSGRPVITNEVGDVRMYLRDGENVFLSKSDDSSNIAQVMKEILNNPDRAEIVGMKGRQVAREQFHYSNFTKSVDGFLRRVCGRQ